MRERIATVAPIAAAAAAVGLCCGLPAVLSTGVAAAIAGWSLQSWALIGLGLGLIALVGARWARSRHQKTCTRPEPGPPEDAAAVQTADSTTHLSTDVTRRETTP